MPICRRALVPGALLLGLTSCGPGTMDVARTTTLIAAPRAARFVVVLTDDQQTDPDALRDAQLIVAQLESDGLVAADKTADATYAVMLSRSAPAGHASDESESSGGGVGGGRGGRGMGGMGGGGRGGGVGRHGGGGGGRTDTGDATLRIGIFDLTKARRADERVFFAEVHVPSKGQPSDAVANAMISAALDGFPGKRRESYARPLPPASAEDASQAASCGF